MKMKAEKTGCIYFFNLCLLFSFWFFLFYSECFIGVVSVQTITWYPFKRAFTILLTRVLIICYRHNNFFSHFKNVDHCEQIV